MSARPSPEYHLGHALRARGATLRLRGVCRLVLVPVGAGQGGRGDDVGERPYIWHYSHATRTPDSLPAAYEAAPETQISTEGELA